MNWLKICEKVGKAVAEATDGVWGTEKASEKIKVNESGDTTLFIDDVAEKAAIRVLEKEVKDFTLVSEELGVRKFGRGGVFVFLDPIDGSANAKRGIPEFAVAIGVGKTQKLSGLFFNYVFNPITKEVFHAEKGKGSFRNGKLVRTRAEDDVRLVCISTSRSTRESFEAAARLSPQNHGVHFRTPPAALTFAYVACGSADAGIETKSGCRLLDISTAFLLVMEAGGVVTDEKRQSLEDKTVNASDCTFFIASQNKRMHDKILKLLNG